MARAGQTHVFDKVYNPSDFQDFCTMPFPMEELITRLRLAIKKSQK